MNKIKLFGTTISETITAFRKESSNGFVDLSAGRKRISSQGKSRAARMQGNEKLIAISRLVISLLIVIIAGYLFFVDTKSDVAMALIGFVVGYWLK